MQKLLLCLLSLTATSCYQTLLVVGESGKAHPITVLGDVEKRTVLKSYSEVGASMTILPCLIGGKKGFQSIRYQILKFEKYDNYVQDGRFLGMSQVTDIIAKDELSRSGCRTN